MVETKIGENGKIQRQMGWMEDLEKDGIQKVETWERHKQRMKCQIFYNMYFISACSFLSYIEKESKVSTKGRKNTQEHSQAFPIFIANWLAFNFDVLVF